MTEKTPLELIGLTQEDLQKQVVDKIANHFLDGHPGESDIVDEVLGVLRKTTKEHIDQTVAAVALRHVLPNITKYIEELTLQETNRWGEKKGKELTFTEYLVARAEAYLSEKVSYAGKTKAEAGQYSWRGEQTRITHLVHQHLHHNIETAMKGAAKTVNDALADGIAETVKIKLGEIQKSLRVKVES